MVAPQYIGITIGPVVKTIAMTSSPGGMWGASYLFSYIAKSMCQKLIDVKLPVENIISPYLELDQKNSIINQKPGVGLFSDRIIFKTIDEIDSAKLTTLIEEIKTEIGESLYHDLEKFNEVSDKQAVTDYVNAYLQIDFIKTAIDEGKNPLISLSQQLDAIELQQRFIGQEGCNYFLKLFDNRTRNADENAGDIERNRKIKECFLVDDFAPKDGQNRYQNWPLTVGNNRSIATLEKIAKGQANKSLKRYKYYAIVQADGDNIGKILKGFCHPVNSSVGSTMDEQIRNFSKNCFEYCQKAIDEIVGAGGVPIYAGGDDLLFIAPVYSEKTGNIFKLLSRIEGQFKSVFNSYEACEPSLSFGVSIHYHKFPLYEAFNQALELLFYVAKNSEGKNALAINFQKHAGQCFGYLIKKTATSQTYKEMIALIEQNWEANIDKNGKQQEDQKQTETSGHNDKDDFLRSIAHKLKDFEHLFVEAMKMPSHEALENLFDNLFDCEIHGHKEEVDGAIVYSGNRLYIEKIKALLLSIKTDKQIITLEEIKNEQYEFNRQLKTIDSILRTLKFYSEREGAQA